VATETKVRACAAIILKRGKVLISQRRSDQSFPLKWELPGGHIEPNESKETCLKRELEEELGGHITALKLFASRETTIRNYTILIHYYLCKLRDGKLKKLEVNDFRWIEPSKYALYDLGPPDKSVLRKLLKTPA